MNSLRSKLSRKFTKWYIKRGYTFEYDFTDVPILGDGLLRAPAGIPKSIFHCPWWVRPLLIFFSPSTYTIDTFGKMMAEAIQEGINSVTEDDVKAFQQQLNKSFGVPSELLNKEPHTEESSPN